MSQSVANSSRSGGTTWSTSGPTAPSSAGRKGQANPATEIPLQLSYLIAYFGLLTFVHWSKLFDVEQSNQFFPIALMLGCFWAVKNLLWRCPVTMLTPYPMVLTMVGMYHGFGSLAPIWSSPATQSYISGSYLLTPERLESTNLLNLAGTLFLCIGALIGHSMGGNSQRSGSVRLRPLDIPSASKLSMLALAIGLPIFLFLHLPASFRWLPFVLPGAIETLGSFVHVALILQAFLVEHRQRFAKGALALTVSIVLLGSVITFAKEGILLVVMMPFIGAYLATRKTSRLVAGGLCVVVVYALLVPVISRGRTLLRREVAEDSVDVGIALETRYRVLLQAINESWFNPVHGRDPGDDLQIWWSRLSYNNVQSFAMDRNDAGDAGETLRHAFITFIPRVLWPNKPMTAILGVEFQQKYTGRFSDWETSIGIGLFGEAYWDLGWWGLALGAMGVGLELAIMGNLFFRHLRQGDALAYICVWLYGVVTARSIDKWIVMAFIGNLPIYIGLYVISNYFAQRIIRPRPTAPIARFA